MLTSVKWQLEFDKHVCTKFYARLSHSTELHLLVKVSINSIYNNINSLNNKNTCNYRNKSKKVKAVLTIAFAKAQIHTLSKRVKMILLC